MKWNKKEIGELFQTVSWLSHHERDQQFADYRHAQTNLQLLLMFLESLPLAVFEDSRFSASALSAVTACQDLFLEIVPESCRDRLKVQVEEYAKRFLGDAVEISVVARWKFTFQRLAVRCLESASKPARGVERHPEWKHCLHEARKALKSTKKRLTGGSSK